LISIIHLIAWIKSLINFHCRNKIKCTSTILLQYSPKSFWLSYLWCIVTYPAVHIDHIWQGKWISNTNIQFEWISLIIYVSLLFPWHQWCLQACGKSLDKKVRLVITSMALIEWLHTRFASLNHQKLFVTWNIFFSV
jgi:hypothetical protein